MNKLGGFDSRSAKPSGLCNVTGSKVFGTGKRTASRKAKSAATLGTPFLCNAI